MSGLWDIGLPGSIQGVDNYFNGNQGYSFSADQATISYERQRQLRQTAYQDTVGDLTAAGLNPMLAYTQGASSAGSVAQASNPGPGPGATAIPGLISSAVSAYLAGATKLATQAGAAKDQATTGGILGNDSNNATSNKTFADAVKATADAKMSEYSQQKAQALLVAVAQAGGTKMSETVTGSTDAGLMKYASEYLVKPEVQAALKDMATNKNETALQEFTNIPAVNELMKLAQLVVRVFLHMSSSRGSSAGSSVFRDNPLPTLPLR